MCTRELTVNLGSDDNSDIKLIDDILLSERGHMGTSAKYNDIISLIDVQGIGTIRVKCLFKDKKISIIVFSNGSLKLSGGLPDDCLRNDAKIKEFIISFSDSLSKWMPFDITDYPSIVNLNGQFQVPPFKTYSAFENHINALRNFGSFAKIIVPTLLLKGRRCAWKFFPWEHRNLNLKIDTKGAGQIFAASSFRELKMVEEMFNQA